MKKHIICHYKNGALLFCTVGAYPPDVASTIAKIFSQQELVSAVEPRAKNLFRVVGRANLNYDPFESSSIKWGDLLSKMTNTLEILEDGLKPYLCKELISVKISGESAHLVRANS